ncbi:MAG: hypothetical protein KKD48_03530, partial [Nanoarchaeota archaeon]|nr:hypothetical protein [Nanoarchaeota archaeon]
IVEYAGKTYIIDKGQTKTMDDGTIVGITDVTAVHESGAGQDMCELAIGAHKLVLESGKKASVNNEDVDNSYVYISGNETANVAGLKYITLSYQPEDNVWLLPGESLEDPIFSAFKIVFNKLNEKNMEEIKIDLVGDKVKAKMTNKDGDIFDDYICYLNGTGTNRQFRLGYSNKKPMAVFDGQVITNNTAHMGEEGVTLTPKSMKGVRFLYTFSGVSHIAEITDIDTANNKTTFKVLDSGEVYKDLEYTDGTTTTFSDVNSNLQIRYNMNVAAAVGNITFVNIQDGDSRWETFNGANITFYNHSGGVLPENVSFANVGAGTIGGASGCDLGFTEIDTGKETEVTLQNGVTKMNISFRYDATDDDIEWNQTGSTALGGSVSLKQKDDDSTNDYAGRTPYGTKIVMYQKDDGDLTIMYPEEAVYAEVIVAASEAVTGTLATANVVKESEVTDITAQNVILVGGPCANRLTASLTGASSSWPDCSTGYTEGSAMLKLMDNGNKVALIVAGYSADDTKRAAVALSGTLPAKIQATVTGTSLELSQINVA